MEWVLREKEGRDEKGICTWIFITRIAGISSDKLKTGSSTKRAMWSILRGDKKRSTPKGWNAAEFEANSFFLSLSRE